MDISQAGIRRTPFLPGQARPRCPEPEPWVLLGGVDRFLSPESASRMLHITRSRHPVKGSKALVVPARSMDSPSQYLLMCSKDGKKAGASLSCLKGSLLSINFDLQRAS